ncbi:MAG: SusD/RagB family nutrient-binding outer membrane lipoprotein [Chitinophagaceae bacterium]|nr:SusD/RagB family nutrient-binding outer membrane lipoprotein [Chitinophagaceae bacterium]
MKLNCKYFIAAGLIGLVTASSCSKKLEEAYANPNALTKQPVELIFPSLIGSLTGSSSAAGSAYGMCNDGLLIGRYIQFWGSYISSATDNTGTFYDKMAGTVGASDNMGSMWAAHYYGMGQNINRIIEWGSEEQKWDFVGAAWALRAWSLFTSTNQYGEMILRQAFDQSLQQFTYESQAEIYDSVRAICHRALNFLNSSGGGMNPTTFAASDFYFNGGSLDRWKKFVHGILARSFAYLHNKPSYNADSVIYHAELAQATNADNATAKFQNTGITGTSNYFGTARGNVNNATSGIRQTAFIADLMSGANTLAFTGVADPRAWYILRGNPNGTIKGYSPSWSVAINPALATADLPESFVGTAYGTTGYTPLAGLPTTAGTAGKYIFRDEAEFPVMTASEMQFLIAEAYIRKGLYASAKTAYVNGISLNFDMLSTKYNINILPGKDINAGNKAAYLANPAVVPVVPDATNMTLTKVMLQKYIALYGWGIHETWVDMRRYHYNNLDPATGQQVYAGFKVPAGVDLWSGSQGSNLGAQVYRTRPRYNSEYLYNIPALTAIGAYPVGNQYHTKECWFSLP